MEIKHTTTTLSPKAKLPHSITLQSRSKAILAGVENVLGASEEIVNLVTSEGTLSIFGKSLKIQKFNIEDGALVLDGIIDSIKYAAVKTPILKRLFK
ncbi:MAG: YabP/YqfC family sporulation protein [Firmicutes bacterium]|nr:YabP/YqfC family sporulation protein [Bacillota bacterium]